MFSNTWRLFSLAFFIILGLVLSGIYFFAPEVWNHMWQYNPGSPYVNTP